MTDPCELEEELFMLEILLLEVPKELDELSILLETELLLCVSLLSSLPLELLSQPLITNAEVMTKAPNRE